MSDPKVRKRAAPAPDSVPSSVGKAPTSVAAGDSNRPLEMVAPGRLVPNKRNARTHSKQQIEQIARSIERFGFIGPVLVDESGQIIAGHGRVEAAKRLGLDRVPVQRVTHLSADERKAFALADNRLAELAGWDGEILAAELQTLLELNFDIELTGFQIDDIDIVRDRPKKDAPKKLHDRDSATDAGIAGSAASAAVSRAGDLWWLGTHRLRCGDDDNANSYAAVDVALRGWQRVTGESARLDGSGRTFAEIAKERTSTASPNAASNAECRQSRAANREAA